MISEDGTRILCNHPTCSSYIMNHRWGKTKAAGWFFTKGDDAYYPMHHPSWVTKWRAKRNN